MVSNKVSISRQFFYNADVFYTKKNLDTARTATEMKETCCFEFFLVKIFVTFFKLLKISRDKYSLFLIHVWQVF